MKAADSNPFCTFQKNRQLVALAASVGSFKRVSLMGLGGFLMAGEPLHATSLAVLSQRVASSKNGFEFESLKLCTNLAETLLVRSSSRLKQPSDAPVDDRSGSQSLSVLLGKTDRFCKIEKLPLRLVSMNITRYY